MITIKELRIPLNGKLFDEYVKEYNIIMGVSTGPLDNDTIREKPTLERKREWAHGMEGKGKDCDRYTKPVYTPPESVPGTCHDWNCENTEYQSKGVVTRNKATKEIVDREAKR